MLDRAISVLPSFAPAYAARGAALLQQGETRSALESLVRSLALRPSDARSHSLAGAALMRLAQEALGGERTHAASRKKTRRQQHNVIAAMLVRAEEHFSTARSLNPADARVQVNLDRTQRVLVALRALPR
jgi:tetratricopeptide (TPR) repeat protein